MRFVPNYCVSYRGAFHNAGRAFEIDREDAEEMSRHGTVAEDAPAEGLAEAVDSSAAEGLTESEEAPLRRPGRPRKADTE